MKQIKKAALAACTTLLLSYGAYAQSWPSIAPTINDGLHEVSSGTTPITMNAINSDMIKTGIGFLDATIYERNGSSGNPEVFVRNTITADSVMYSLQPGATHPDIAFFNFPVRPDCNDFFIGVVYEYSGDVYFELLILNNVTTGGMTLGSTGVTKLSADQVNHVDSRWPHIDAFPEPSGLPVCSGSNLWKMVVTWSENIGGGYNIYAAVDDINTTPPLPFSTLQLIDQGFASDVAAVTDISTSGNPQTAYFTYYDRSSGTINHADWDISTTTVNTYPAIESGTFSYCPRIEAQNLGAKTTGTITSRILWEAVAQVNKTGLEEVHAYGYNTASGLVSTDNYAAMLSPINTYNHYMPAVSAGQGANNTSNAGALGNNSFTIGWYMGTDNNIQALQLSNDLPSTVLTGFRQVNKFPIASGPTPVCAFASCSNTGDYLGSYWHNNYISSKTVVPFPGFPPTTYYYDHIGLKINATTTYGFKSTGINNVSSNETSYLYPNPAKDIISVFSAEGADYTITDVMGRSLQTGKFSSKNNTVDISALTPGMYILVLDKSDTKQNIKFAKQ